MATLNVALVGAGRIALVHAVGYRDCEGARIYAVCDRNREAAESLGQTARRTAAYS